MTERSMFDPHIGKLVYYPGCAVNIVAGERYEIALIDVEEPMVAAFVARRCVDFKSGRRWIMDPVAGGPPMFVWVNEILDQIGVSIIVGQPWNYDRFYSDKTITVAA